MKFPEVRKTSFEKNSCSPKGELKRETDLLVEWPKEILWGEPLPLCGAIKAPEYMDVTLRILDKKREQIPGVISSSIDLVPQLSSFPQAQQDFKKQGFLYFNTNGFSDERNPPPGQYEIEIETYDGKAKVKNPLVIKSEGKKFEFANALMKQICEKEALKKFKNYFNAVSALESCGDPLPGKEAKEPDQNQLKANMRSEWKKIWPSLEKDFSSFQKSDMIQWAGYYEQAPMVHVISGLVEKSCPSQKDTANNNVHLRMLVESFSQLAE